MGLFSKLTDSFCDSRTGAKRPIAQRIRFFLLLMTSVAVLFFLFIVWVIQENLETTMLNTEYEHERALFFDNLDLTGKTLWQAHNNTFAFLRDDDSREVLPDYLQDKPVGFRKEIIIGDTTCLVNVERVDDGTLYISKDISHFEDRVTFYLLLVSGFAVLVILLSVFVAHYLSRQIARPLVRLARLINEQQISSRLKPLDTDFRDYELAEISRSIDFFIKRINDYNRREKDLLRMASHELRTPIAVNLGGFDILKHRGSLTPKDAVTIQRMQNACLEMQHNVEMILKISRQQASEEVVRQPINLAVLLAEIQADCAEVYPAEVHRLEITTLTQGQSPIVVSHYEMLKILLRNLIHNALQHTPGSVDVAVIEPENAVIPHSGLAPLPEESAADAVFLEIRDHGLGFSSEQKALLKSWWHLGDIEASSGSVSGLGLYIATLISENLNISLLLGSTEEGGNIIQIRLPTPKDNQLK